MSLMFSGGAQLVDCTSAAVLDDLDPMTYVVLYYPTTIVGNAFLVAKTDASNNGRHLGLKNVAGALSWGLHWSTQDVFYPTADGVVAADTHYLTAVTYDGGASPMSHIYHTTRSVAVSEASYGVTLDGTGTVGTDNADSLTIGNRAAGDKGYTGEISAVFVFSKVLTTTELDTIRSLTLAQAQNWSTTPQVTGCIGLWICDSATTLTDRSGQGNDATVTGATLGSNEWPWAAGVGLDRLSARIGLRTGPAGLRGRRSAAVRK